MSARARATPRRWPLLSLHAAARVGVPAVGVAARCPSLLLLQPAAANPSTATASASRNRDIPAEGSSGPEADAPEEPPRRRRSMPSRSRCRPDRTRRLSRSRWLHPRVAASRRAARVRGRRRAWKAARLAAPGHARGQPRARQPRPAERPARSRRRRGRNARPLVPRPRGRGQAARDPAPRRGRTRGCAREAPVRAGLAAPLDDEALLEAAVEHACAGFARADWTVEAAIESPSSAAEARESSSCTPRPATADAGQ